MVARGLQRLCLCVVVRVLEEFYSTVTALRWAAFWTLAPCPMRYRRCQRVGTDCPAAWGMPEVHGEGIRSERRFGREAVLSINAEFHLVKS